MCTQGWWIDHELIMISDGFHMFFFTSNPCTWKMLLSWKRCRVSCLIKWVDGLIFLISCIPVVLRLLFHLASRSATGTQKTFYLFSSAILFFKKTVASFMNINLIWKKNAYTSRQIILSFSFWVPKLLRLITKDTNSGRYISPCLVLSTWMSLFMTVEPLTCEVPFWVCSLYSAMNKMVFRVWKF